MADPTAPDASPPTRRGLYESSSQYQHWRFSPAQLQEMRDNLTNKAVSTIRAAFERDEPGSSNALEFLSSADELALVRLYATKIPQLSAHFRFSEEIEATGISYLKRFYLKNTVMDHHPKNIMLTALFLAAKTCNRMVAIDDYVSRIPKTTAADVLDLEFPVAQSLNFEFAVWHAHRALWGLFLDMQTLEPPPDPDVLHEAHKIALDAIRRSRLSDVEILYAPSQIALACLHRANPDLVRRWLATKGEDLDFAEGLCNAITNEIDAHGVAPPVEMVREIDRRLKLCKNPETIPGSRAYLRRRAELEALAAAKRKRKAERARAALEAEGDPFGPGMGDGAGAGSDSSGAGMDVD
ncbi:cyclin-like protein [Exidia glandulosa HHB12029]|uniref:Cyclin-like protein n=1 Tax=Exidia glandulosa HHB12029 TaxID=1314781 RepID=A0A165HNP9_EXIGL|nr:cyclin-like protein [Exidia glandulosa HHB12029]